MNRSLGVCAKYCIAKREMICQIRRNRTICQDSSPSSSPSHLFARKFRFVVCLHMRMVRRVILTPDFARPCVIHTHFQDEFDLQVTRSSRVMFQPIKVFINIRILQAPLIFDLDVVRAKNARSEDLFSIFFFVGFAVIDCNSSS